MHTDIVCIKADDIYKEIAENVETIGKNEKAIGLMKDELDGKIMVKLLD